MIRSHLLRLYCVLLLASASVVSAQTPSPQPSPMNIPPWASATPMDFSGPPDPDGAPQFDPTYGGLPLGQQGAFSPSGDAAVNLATGSEQYLAEPDMDANNPIGEDAAFERCFYSERALSGYSSPGLSRGWVHNYDLTIAPVPGHYSWGPLLLTYPGGSQELLTPELDAHEKPTGAFRPNGAPYTVRGRAGAVAGQWKAIGLIWGGGSDAVWRFIPRKRIYILTSVINGLGNGCQLRWDERRRLTDVNRTDNGGCLLHLEYDSAGGDLSSIVDSTGREVKYTFIKPSSAAEPSLHTVSFIADETNRLLETHYTFDYICLGTTPLLCAISVPSPSGIGLSTCHIDYDKSRVSVQKDAVGDTHTYTYRPYHTLVQIAGADGKIVEYWTQNYDAIGRDTGTTDAAGHSTVLKY